MPEFVYDIPLRTLAMYMALIAVASIVFGLLIIKPILRLLIGSPPDLNESIGYGPPASACSTGCCSAC